MAQQQQCSNPPGTKRLLVIASAVAYVVFLGVPVWWHTTSLHRPPLPHEAMQQVAVEASSNAAFLPISLELVVVLPGDKVPAGFAAALHSSVQAAAAASIPESAAHIAVTVTGAIAIAAAAGACQQHPAAAAAGAAASPACAADWTAAATYLRHHNTKQVNQQLDDWLLLLQQQEQQQEQQAQTCSASQDAGHYRLYLLPSTVPPQQPSNADDNSNQAASPTLVVGRHRHAWLTYDSSSLAVLEAAGLQDLAAAAVVRSLSCCFALHSGPAGLQAAGSLPISPSGQTHLSLSLLNADPAAGPHYTWDMEQWGAQHLSPVTTSLAPVTQVSIESQVLQYAAARLPGRWSDKHGAYVVKGSQLPFFIDSEWAIESGRAVTPQEQGLGGYIGGNAAASSASASAAAAAAHADNNSSMPASAAVAARARDTASLVEPHVLQFLVYVPPKQHRPLQLLGRKGRIRDSNSYVIPSWGGLLVINPQDSLTADRPDTDRAPTTGNSCSAGCTQGDGGSNCTAATDSCGGGLLAAAAELTAEQYEHIAAVVIAQLQALFGVAVQEPDSSSSSSAAATSIEVQQLPAGQPGFSGWQVDALLRQRSAHDVREASRVLAALSTLVQELPNLEMPDLISQLVVEALSDISRAWQYTAAGNYTAAAAAATTAHGAAEAAFSHPAVLAQLNFPDSHKLGVYMPLFLPLCVPLIQGLMLQLTHFTKRRRECRQ